jgi:hypothetical protein
MRSDQHSKLMSYLQSDEGRQSIIEYFTELDDKDKKIRDYFETDSFFSELDDIRKWMIENNENSICDEDFLYPRRPLPILDESFHRLTSCILKSLEKEEKCCEDIGFANGHVEYKEWCVNWISDQGSITSLVLYRDRMRDDAISSIVD